MTEQKGWRAIPPSLLLFLFSCWARAHIRVHLPCPAGAWHFPWRRDSDEWGSVLGSPGRELALSASLLSVSTKRAADHSGREWKGSYNSFHELARVRKEKKKKGKKLYQFVRSLSQPAQVCRTSLSKSCFPLNELRVRSWLFILHCHETWRDSTLWVLHLHQEDGANLISCSQFVPSRRLLGWVEASKYNNHRLMRYQKI